MPVCSMMCSVLLASLVTVADRAGGKMDHVYCGPQTANTPQNINSMYTHVCV